MNNVATNLMKPEAAAKWTRRSVVTSATGLAVGALAVSTARGQSPTSANAIHPEKLEAVSHASHSCLSEGHGALALSGKQLADGDTRMADCNRSCINMLAVSTAMHTISTHGTADPAIIKGVAAAAHKACLDCEAACAEFDHPVYQSCAAACRRTASHCTAIVES